MTDTMKPPNDNAKPKPTKPADDAIRVRELYFVQQGGVDLPSEQRRARITSTPNGANSWLYEINYLPRVDKFHVRAFEPSGANAKRNPTPKYTFLIPGSWAVADLEPQ